MGIQINGNNDTITALDGSWTAAGLSINTSGILTATNIVSDAATFAGNVSIAGTLTYEDVTNIDSVGIITGKGADINGDLDVDGHTNLDNVNIVGVTTTNGNLNVNGASYLYGSGGASVVWGNTGYSGHLTFDGSDNAVIRAASGKALIIQTNHVNERLRITSGGNIGVGNDGSFPIYEDTNDRNFILGTGSDDTAIQIHSGSDKYGGLYFGDATSGGDRYRGYVEFKHGTSDDFLRLGAGGNERLRITSDGKFSLGTINASPGAAFHLDYDSNNLLMLDNHSASTQKIFFAQQGATHAQIYGTSASGAVTIESDPSNNHSSSLINFKVDSVEQMVISNTGLGIGTATSSGGLHIYRPDAQVRLYDTTTSGSQTAFRVMAYNGVTHFQSGTAFSSDSKAPMIFGSMFGGTEWVRIDTSGRLLINQTAGDGDNKLQISGNNDDRVQIRIKRTNAIGGNAVYGGIDIVDNNNADVASIRALNEAGATASYFSFKTYTSGGSLSEKLRITSKGLLELVSGEGLKLNPYVSGQYALNGTLSYYATNNGVYLNGAGADGWLRLNAAGTENDRNAINIYGSSHSSADQIALRVASSTRIAMRNSAHCVHVQGETAATGTSHGSKGFSIQTGGGTSCPIYFGSETSVAQKSMYLSGYWIYLRGHINEGMRFIFSQGSGAPHGDYYEFKYNSAKRPGNSTTWDGFSDSRAKENVQSITNGIEKIKQLRPVTYDWTDDYADSTGMYIMNDGFGAHKENGYDTNAKNGQYGFLAQEYETVLPKDVKQQKFTLGDTELTDFRTINHDSLIPTLTAALKEAIAKIEVLETEVAALKGS